MLGSTSIRFATTIADVHRTLQSSMIDLIICEYLLNDRRNGQQLLEELKTDKLLPWNTSFVMITGERRYSNVIGVVELEPDDYLIKPFSPSQLSDRIIRLFQKKVSIAPVLKSLFNGDFAAAIRECDELSAQFSQYAPDLVRMKVMALIEQGALNDAITTLESLIKTQPAPWMRMSLAKIYCKNKLWQKAHDELIELIKEKPEFVAARDLLADVLWELNKPDQALEMLEELGYSGTGNTQRLRKMADLSLRTDQSDKAKNYLKKVISRTKNTSLSQLDDYINLINIHLEEGNQMEVARIESQMRNTVSLQDIEVGQLLIGLKQAIRDKKSEQANGLLDKAIGLTKKEETIPKPSVHINLVEACFDLGRFQAGLAQASLLASRGVGRNILDRIKSAIDKSKKKAATSG